MENLNNIKMTLEQAEKIGEELGEKLRAISDKACEDANELCKKHGLRVVMQFCLEPKNE